jgi:outer membrane protein TolC
MTRRLAAACIIVLMAPAGVAAQSAGAGDTTPEQLSLERAVQIALENNRDLQSARLQVSKAEDDLGAARTRRLPAFDTEVNLSQLLTPAQFGFPKGAFGEYPGVGPIPSVETTVEVPRQPTAYVSAQVSQPLSQLFRIGLTVKNAETARDVERERVRGHTLSLVNGVKRQYFAILQTQSALTATDEAIDLYKALDRTLQVRVAQKVALRSDSLDVQYRLAEAELSRTTQQNSLASQKEQLNALLGRDVRTRFAVDPVSAISAFEVDVEAAQRNALATRPDVQEARLKLQQAELDRRIKKSERIPDVSIAASYASNFNIDVLPKNLALVGVQVKWEPFDWGRRNRELASKAHTVDQARLNVREAEDQAVLEINSRFRALNEKRALLRVVEMAQATAREKLRVKTNQYQVQAVLLPDVLQLRAELADSTDRYQQALLAFWTAKADFDQAVGEEALK